jgi:hypothetical protein
VIPITLLFQFARGYLGIINGAVFVGALCTLIALIATAQLEETFSKDLAQRTWLKGLGLFGNHL